MVRRLSALLVPAIAVIGMAIPSAQADHGCNGSVTSIGDAAYLEDRGEGGLWLYAESNGTAGLQSGGDAVSGLYADDCAHANPDLLIY